MTRVNKRTITANLVKTSEVLNTRIISVALANKFKGENL